MPTLADVIEGSVTIDTEGTRATRAFIVSEVTGDAANKLYSAITAPDIPDVGESHPAIPGIKVIEKTASSQDKENTIYRVTVNYGNSTFENQTPDNIQEPIIQVGSSLTSAKTQKDHNGEQIIVTLQPENGKEMEQPGEIDIQIPQSVIQFERKEIGSPLIKSIFYTGTVNNNNIGVFNERTLLCTGIQGISNDNGITYNVTYSFQYNPDTWDVTAVYIDSATGKQHKDVSIADGNGIETARVYKENDFSSLNLNF